MNNRTTITIVLLAVVMILGTANAVNVTDIYDSDENNSVSPCESCPEYQANGTFSEERANDTYAENGSLSNITNLTGSVCDDEVPIVNISSPVGMNESTVDLSITNDNTTVATDVIRDGAVVNETASMASASPASEGVHASGNAEIAHSAIHEYEGAKNCKTCHLHPTEHFATSIHNRWMGTDSVGNQTGKLVGINDFCGAVTSNEALCGKCHAGFGLPDDLSFDKIDCLICHAPNYKKTATGPDPSITISEVTPGIGLPTREYCLRCHATAGGGDNNKRGDLELAMGAANVSKDLDVHMGGQNMTCQNCHIFEDEHHVSGKGMDLRVNDTDTIVSCEQCHNSTPHPAGSMYNKHTDRIACTACHITSYGKETS
ncbi:MAG: hypothetical protein J7J06_08950, partial [Methanosarcinales archaeon]|nr:hypothetical protein [Methanosarcinales archaeon]